MEFFEGFGKNEKTLKTLLFRGLFVVRPQGLEPWTH